MRVSVDISTTRDDRTMLQLLYIVFTESLYTSENTHIAKKFIINLDITVVFSMLNVKCMDYYYVGEDTRVIYLVYIESGCSLVFRALLTFQ